MPSLHPDSADKRSRRCLGMRLANFPLPTTEDARTGSVAVTHAAHARDSSQLKLGIIHQINSDVISHPKVMTGTSKNTTDLQCLVMYFYHPSAFQTRKQTPTQEKSTLGNSTPTAKHCTTKTIRENSSVIWSTFPQSLGTNNPAPYGPNIMPQIVATAAVSNQHCAHTSGNL